MTRRLAVLALCLLAVTLAGCGSLSDVTDSPSVGEQRHPFADETVTVTVDGTDRERALTAEALAYWTDNASEYAGFPVEFRVLGPDETPANGPDVVVRFAETVTDCGDSDYSAGCAPRINDSTAFDRPATVRIQRGFDDESTRLVVRHEAGHLLGLDHEDRPQSIMRHESQLTTLPRPDASERAVPWNDTTLTVAVDNGTVPPDERAAYREEVAYGLGYVNAGADGTVPETVTLRLVDNTDTADIVVSNVDASDCRSGSGSCLLLEGTDPDGDGAIETYTRAGVELLDLDTDAVSWHVARQLLSALEVDSVPDRLADATAAERRGAWYG